MDELDKATKKIQMALWMRRKVNLHDLTNKKPLYILDKDIRIVKSILWKCTNYSEQQQEGSTVTKGRRSVAQIRIVI